MYEYKFCPKCHKLFPMGYEKCKCGTRFTKKDVVVSEGNLATYPHIQELKRRLRRETLLIATPLVAVSLLLLTLIVRIALILWQL